MFNLNKNRATLLVIDIQERLANSMQSDEFSSMLKNTKMLINGCSILKLPIIQSLQYRKGLGESIEGLFGEDIKKINFEKMVFSCCYENSEFVSFLEQNKQIEQIIIAGMEAHICVLQTARDLLKQNYQVIIASDCVISRNNANKQNALNLISQIGGFAINNESILFDLLKSSTADEFKAISAIIK
ncbi:MAG: isochorismatase family protein [Helicobacteraceae bacterium]|nr:isochorismatase family protein [Helicobacteraceae bacterium]